MGDPAPSKIILKWTLYKTLGPINECIYTFTKLD
jgi:hypothetical protein